MKMKRLFSIDDILFNNTTNDSATLPFYPQSLPEPSPMYETDLVSSNTSPIFLRLPTTLIDNGSISSHPQINIELDAFDDDIISSNSSSSYSNQAKTAAFMLHNRTMSECFERKCRTVYTQSQVFYLSLIFDNKQFLSRNERAVVAATMRLTPSQVKVWFQNRRNKHKREQRPYGRLTGISSDDSLIGASSSISMMTTMSSLLSSPSANIAQLLAIPYNPISP